MRYRRVKQPVILMDPAVDQCRLCQLLISGAWKDNPHRVAMTVLLRIDKIQDILVQRTKLLNGVCVRLLTLSQELQASVGGSAEVRRLLDEISLQIHIIKDCFYREMVGGPQEVRS